MSITKSYNKQTNTYYAYETSYEWSDEKQKKVQRKRCIGQFDPDTGKIIPNGKVGRPGLSEQSGALVKDAAHEKNSPNMQLGDAGKLAARLTKIEETLQALSAEIHDLCAEIDPSAVQDR